MVRISPAQRTMLRLGAAMCLLAVPLLVVVALAIDTSPPDDADATTVADPTDIDLPSLGLLSGEVVVYGASDSTTGVAARDLDCELRTPSGGRGNSALLDHLSVIGTPAVTVDGKELRPLFAVSGYQTGSTISCGQADAVMPMAVSAPSTFGGNADLVRGFALGTAALMLVVGASAWFLLRPRSDGGVAR